MPGSVRGLPRQNLSPGGASRVQASATQAQEPQTSQQRGGQAGWPAGGLHAGRYPTLGALQSPPSRHRPTTQSLADILVEFRAPGIKRRAHKLPGKQVTHREGRVKTVSDAQLLRKLANEAMPST